MSKSRLPFNPSEYALVADRITAFYSRHPTGRIITRLVSRDRDVVFRSAVYRTAEDRAPAATGWASEREGNGEINMYACLENTETSAIGRALANLGFTASLKRPSREEMQKVERARHMRGNQVARVAENSPLRPYASTAPPATITKDDDLLVLGDPRPGLIDLEELVDKVQLRGFPTARLATIRAMLESEALGPETIARLERTLRAWLARRRPPGVL